MEGVFNCERCGENYALKEDLLKHLRSKKKCIPTLCDIPTRELIKRLSSPALKVNEKTKEEGKEEVKEEKPAVIDYRLTQRIAISTRDSESQDVNTLTALINDSLEEISNIKRPQPSSGKGIEFSVLAMSEIGEIKKVSGVFNHAQIDRANYDRLMTVKLTPYVIAQEIYNNIHMLYHIYNEQQKGKTI